MRREWCKVVQIYLDIGCIDMYSYWIKYLFELENCCGSQLKMLQGPAVKKKTGGAVAVMKDLQRPVQELQTAVALKAILTSWMHWAFS